jgi:hypothetical protein
MFPFRRWTGSGVDYHTLHDAAQLQLGRPKLGGLKGPARAAEKVMAPAQFLREPPRI